MPLVTGTAGLFLGTWQAGKRSGKQEAELEAKIKADLKKETDDKIEALRNEMRASLAEATEGPEEFIKSIGDTFTAGSLGKFTVGADGEVLLGDPYVFDASNIDKFNF